MPSTHPLYTKITRPDSGNSVGGGGLNVVTTGSANASVPGASVSSLSSNSEFSQLIARTKSAFEVFSKQESDPDKAVLFEQLAQAWSLK